MAGFIIIPIVIALMIILAVVGHLAAKKRREELFLLATRLGLQFDPDPFELHARYSGFAPFDRGGSRRSSNLLSGRIGEIDWDIFEYRYTTGTGKNRKTHRHGIIAATMPIHLPRMTIRPEGLFDKLASMAGFDDINFESEEFSRRYHVKCDDRKVAYDIVHPQMIEYLLSVSPTNWQIGGRFIILTRNGSFPASEIEPAMKMIEGFVARTPEYIRQERGVLT